MRWPWERNPANAAGEAQKMSIAVLSDSHGRLPRGAAEQAQACDAAVHAGDIVREADLDELAAYGPVYAVRGNCDWDPWAYRLQDVLRFEIGGVKFLMAHDPWSIPRDLQDADVVIHGHTHQYREEWIDGRLWLNPGSCTRPRDGKGPSMAVLTLEKGKVRSVRRIFLEE